MPDDDVLVVGELEVRPAGCEVLFAGRRIPLTVREFQTFHCLVRHLDHVVSRASIYDLVWGGPLPPRDRSVDVFVRKIRRKLAEAAPGELVVHTHFGVGYRLTVGSRDGHAPVTAGSRADAPAARASSVVTHPALGA